MPTTETPPVVVRDLFPAEVTVAATVYRSARALITPERVHVFVVSDGSVTQVLDAPYDAEQSQVAPRASSPRQASHLTLIGDSEGVQVHINRQRGCGCGNPLKVARVSSLLDGARLGPA